MYETRKRIDVMLCYPFEESRLQKWGYPVIVQPKLDGERCRALWNPERCTLLSSSAEEIISVAHINEALMEQRVTHKHELDGELYFHGWDFEDIHSIVSRTVNIHPDATSMEYHVFDLINESVQLERLMDLDALNLEWPLVTVPRVMCQDFDQLWNTYQHFLGKNYEGIIVRHPFSRYIRRRCTTIMKFKPKKDDWYTVVSVKEGEGKHVGSLGAIEFVGDDMDGSTGWVGSGLTDAMRKELWSKDITNWLVHVSYQHITPGGNVPRFPVFLEVIDPKSFE